MIYNFQNDYDITKARAYLEKLIEKKKICEITYKAENRSIKQNSYLHSLLNLYAIEVGDRLLEVKTDLKRECPLMVYEKKGKKYLRSSADLDTKEMTDWINWIKNYAGKNGIFLPDADEFERYYWDIQKEIESHKQYL